MSCPTICIVTQERTTRETLRAALGDGRCEVVELEDGKSAVEQVEREVPDLVVVDLDLPGESGADLLRRLRSVPGCDDLAVIGVAATTARLDEARACAVVFSRLLLHPLDAEELSSAVSALLPRASAEEDLAADRKRVLAVDDDPAQLELLRIQLRTLGLRVTTASDGRSAVRKARDNPPDAIVSDILMPELDGFGLCLEVRRDPNLARVPIVLQSSHYVEEADRLLAQGVGANRMVVRSSGEEPARLVLELLGGIKPWTARPVIGIEREHSQRLVRQLELQLEENRALARRCSELATRLTSMRAVGQAALRNEGVGPVLRDLFVASLEGAGIDFGALYVADPDGELHLRYSIGVAADRTNDLETFFGQTALMRRVAASGTALPLPSPSVEEDGASELLQRTGLSSMLLLPIMAGESCQGLLLLGSHGSDMAACPSLHALGAKIGEALDLATALERLARSEEWHRRIIESTRDGVWMIDAEARTAFVNRRMASMLGASIEELRRERVVERVCEADRARANGEVERLLGGTALQTDLHMVSQEGAEVPVTISADPIFEGGRLAGALLLVSDLSSEREARAQLLVADRMASAGVLASGVAHEINNPLAAVLTNLAVAAEDIAALQSGDIASAAGLGDQIRDARKAAQRVARIVRELQAFSPRRAGDRTKVDVLKVLESSERLVSPKIEGRAKLVTRHRPIPAVEATESLLGQVFLNLLVNATQAIAEGRPDENEIVVRSEVDGKGRVVVCFEDTGCGMSKEVVDRLFTPFFSTKEVGAGKGLGLAICHRIVTSIGGEIRVESRLGHGTKITVLLPAASTESVATA